MSERAPMTEGVALTFDDGPDPVWTRAILAELNRAEAAATFFVIASRAARHRDVIEAAAKAGHAVELHCNEHLPHRGLSPAGIVADAEKGLDTLGSLGILPRLWRPPWGVLGHGSEEAAVSLGLQLVGWDVDTRDWAGGRAGPALVAAVPGLAPGAVVLLHDGVGPGATRSGCAATVAMTGALVGACRERGIEPGPVDPSRSWLGMLRARRAPRAEAAS